MVGHATDDTNIDRTTNDTKFEGFGKIVDLPVTTVQSGTDLLLVLEFSTLAKNIQYQSTNSRTDQRFLYAISHGS